MTFYKYKSRSNFENKHFGFARVQYILQKKLLRNIGNDNAPENEE